MPGSMIDALLVAGLASPAELDKKLEAEKTKILRHLGEVKGSIRGIDGLSTCGSVGEFRDEARLLLLEEPDSISKIIPAAHRFKGLPGGKELIWMLYQLRDMLKVSERRECTQIINRALRRSERTLAKPQ